MAKNRFITGYSGLRALAVIGVILYHLDPNTFVGGYLGVPIFFVLSGYLVTGQILRSYEQKGSFDSKKFYWGRLKKLYPQLITVLWLASAYILLFQRNLLVKLDQIVVSNLLSIYNFWQIANGQSYFERFASNESPFTHLWTMAINGQFYILWPVVVFLLVKYGKKRKKIAGILLGLSLASAVEMAAMFIGKVDINRIYYGTDTRFFALGLGAALALVWPMDKLRANIKQSDARLLDGVGLLTLIGMIALFFSPLMDPQRPFPYCGGMLLFTSLTVVIVGIIAHPGSRWNEWLTNPVFTWMGLRSYGIYLYQFPVMIFFEDKVTNLADHVLIYRLVEVCLILLISELAYRFIEKPLGRITWSQAKQYIASVFDRRTKNYFLKGQAIIASLVLLVGSAAIVISPTVKAQDFSKSQLARQIRFNNQKQERENKSLILKLKKDKIKKQKKAKLVREAKRASRVHPINSKFKKYGISQVDLQLARKVGLTAVGDSVLASSSNDLARLMPKAVIDAAISRQLSAAFGSLSQYKKQHALAQNVLIELGTNGPFPMSDLDQVMDQLGPKRQVFWVNTHVPNRPWQNQVNRLLEQAAKKYHNLVIIDWYAYSKSHPKWFYEDQTHPNPLGSKYYSVLIVKSIIEHAKF